MAVNVKQWGILGAIMGFLTPIVLSTISSVINSVSGITGVTVNLQAITITYTGGSVVTLPASQGSAYFAKVFGLIPNIGIQQMIPEMVMLALGGAAVFIAGAYVADMLGMSSSSKVARLTTVIVVGGLIFGFLASKAIPGVNVWVATVVDAAVLGLIFNALDENLNLGLIP